jgi:hypothetical protein
MNTGLISIRRATVLFSLIRLKSCSRKDFRQIRFPRSLFYKGAAVTADAIELAVKKGIDIVYLDRIGRPFARTYSCEQENSATVQRYQARDYDERAKEWDTSKNQRKAFLELKEKLQGSIFRLYQTSFLEPCTQGQEQKGRLETFSMQCLVKDMELFIQ